MPMFDYRCENCGHVFEELVWSSSVPDEEISCPKCGARKAKRLLSAPAVSVGGSASSTAPSAGSCRAPSGFS
ncbi:MAG: zinc ribbon domain-containing protein [Candidatus Neomarinimicrobiota bacterium]|nr:MAG: zinc ribbon domain-containing protein [Candidatus Neomarinimicrobiota bacterium]